MIEQNVDLSNDEILALIKLILYVKFEDEDLESLFYAGSSLINSALEKMIKRHPYYRDKESNFFGNLPKENLNFLINKLEKSHMLENNSDTLKDKFLLKSITYPYDI